ncbi:hypothetical protein JCM19240_2835 [Vibrio maritimus]|uniref:SURF1-like protein n=1 Tax=Vibrio maritimus TaxID=990268 RepID=A0A090TA01_9VIBR|nr:hypothetical protein JCM19240_2835 [Vibrio maritimus]
MDTPHVRFYQTTKFWVGLVLTVVVFSSLVKLGLWQKQRGNEKVALEQSLALRAQQSPVALSSLDLPLAQHGDHNYQRWIAVPVSAHLNLSLFCSFSITKPLMAKSVTWCCS